MTPSDKKTSSPSMRQRKAYTRPSLTCYGKIADLTETNISKVGNPDGGPSKNDKTGL